MPSPFPGMNPYLEHPTVWHDFHEAFIPRARDMLAEQVLPRYYVKIDEHVFLHEPEDSEGQFIGRGDVAVIDGGRNAGGTATLAIAAPGEVLQAVWDEERLAYLEIRDRESDSVVTVIELLSPANKHGRDRDAFGSKRDHLLVSDVHYVEIDLLRAGPRIFWRNMPSCHYYAIVSREEQRPRAGIWPLSVRDPLPRIPIPLRHGDADAWLDLAGILHRIYDAAGYQYYIYKQPLTPPLSEADEKWAREVASAVKV